MSNSAIKVLNIIGMGHSGSTLLNNTLGQLDGFFATGEFYSVWRGLLNDTLCSCSRPYRECDIWPRIFEEAFGGFDAVDARQIWEQLGAYRRQYGDFRGSVLTPRMALAHHPQDFIAAMGRLYRAIHSVTGARVIVDTSRQLSHAKLMASETDLDFYMLHLVRDPRAAAYSYIRKRDGSLKATLNIAALWAWTNLGAGLAWRGSDRYRRIRYADFVAQPEETTQSILHFLDEEVSELPFPTPASVHFDTTHAVDGNRMRFQTGDIDLTFDQKWIGQMRLRDKLIVTGFNWPFLLAYGYRLMPSE